MARKGKNREEPGNEDQLPLNDPAAIRLNAAINYLAWAICQANWVELPRALHGHLRDEYLKLPVEDSDAEAILIAMNKLHTAVQRKLK
jgi:hypothetical protein